MIGIQNQIESVEVKYLARGLGKPMEIGNWAVCFQHATRRDASGENGRLRSTARRLALAAAGDEIQLKVYLSRWPATIAYKQEMPIQQSP